MSSNKVPSNVESGATRCRMIRLPAYRNQWRRASGWAANQKSGSSAVTAGGELRDNWISRSRT